MAIFVKIKLLFSATKLMTEKKKKCYVSNEFSIDHKMKVLDIYNEIDDQNKGWSLYFYIFNFSFPLTHKTLYMKALLLTQTEFIT